MKEKIRRISDNKLVNYFSPLVLLVLMGLLFTALTGGRFIAARNLKIILNQSIVLAIVGTGAVFIYSTGNLNLAMGSSTAMACMLGVNVYIKTGSFWLMLGSCVLLGVAIMMACCFLSHFLGVGIIVVTNVMMSLMLSLQQWTLTAPIKMPLADMQALKNMNVPILLMLVFFAVCVFLFDGTKLGRMLKFIGENKTCAKMTGMNENKAIVIAFLISGISVGLAATAFLIRNVSVSFNSCSSLNMDVILAIVLAGTPMMGGTRSKIYSGVVGGIMTSMLANGLIMVGVQSYYVQAIQGALFIVILAFGNKRPSTLPVKDMF